MKAFSSSRCLGAAIALVAVSAGTSLAQVASGPAAPPETTQTTPRLHGPMQLNAVVDDRTVESGNWSGYAVTGNSFTQALGSWIVPKVDCSVTPSSYSAFWVGIDGYNSSTVEQTGTQSNCDRNVPRYSAWYEFYPNPSVTITGVPLSPGDVISAVVSYNGGEEFTITLTDVTTGKSFSKSATVAGARRTSAEWIAEAPSSGSGVLPLSDFGTGAFGPDPPSATGTGVTSTNYATEGSGNSTPISAFGRGVKQINMAVKRVLEATTSALSTDGTSFTVTWVSE